MKSGATTAGMVDRAEAFSVVAPLARGLSLTTPERNAE
jgi:hypothetical protein